LDDAGANWIAGRLAHGIPAVPFISDGLTASGGSKAKARRTRPCRSKPCRSKPCRSKDYIARRIIGSSDDAEPRRLHKAASDCIRGVLIAPAIERARHAQSVNAERRSHPM